MRKVYIDDLNLNKYREHGIYWSSAIGKSIKFVYDNVSGELYVNDYNKKTKSLIVTYLDNKFEISTDSLLKARLSRILNNIFIVNKDLADCIVDRSIDIKCLTKCSEKEVIFKCPRCGNVQKSIIRDVFKNGLSCRKCGDKISYPEKYIYNFLEQCNIDFECQKIISNYRYDFYIPSLNLVIEVDGLQHYDKNNNWYCGDTDKKKEKNIIEKGINFVRIDARLSDGNYIKSSIEKSSLNKYLNIDNVDFKTCDLFAQNSYLTMITNEYSKHQDIDCIANKLHMSRKTIRNYLCKASNIGMSNFSIDELKKTGRLKAIEGMKKSCSKRIYLIDDNKNRYLFNSISELCTKSEALFGVKLNYSHIGQCARKEYGRKTHKGFTFEFA